MGPDRPGRFGWLTEASWSTPIMVTADAFSTQPIIGGAHNLRVADTKAILEEGASGAVILGFLGGVVVAARRYVRARWLRVAMDVTAASQVEPVFVIRLVNNSAFDVELHRLELFDFEKAGQPIATQDISPFANPRPPQTLSAGGGKASFSVPITQILTAGGSALREHRNFRLRFLARDDSWIASKQCRIP